MTVMGQAPEAPPAVAPVPSAPDHANTVELRLALVCYGGVSLAIYMHGVTKEIQKLVAASKAYEQDQANCPFESGLTERSYWYALRDLEARDRVRTRVVVDVIAGTSAGGINGIILAKALAHDLPQDSLRDVWLERGDIKQLMASKAARVVPFLPLKLLTWAGVSAMKGRMDPPLDGDRMFRWIREALVEMDKGQRPGATLMPDQHQLELYVTLTDFYGYYRGVPTYDPPRVKDRRHRHVLVFSYSDVKDQLNDDWNSELAFAARATSCFPARFPRSTWRTSRRTCRTGRARSASRTSSGRSTRSRTPMWSARTSWTAACSTTSHSATPWTPCARARPRSRLTGG